MDEEVLDEFKIEAEEMLVESEDFLLNIDRGESFQENFNGIFRAFHSLKGAAGMFEIEDLQAFMHKIETQFESLRDEGTMSSLQIDYFLKAVDSARKILDGEEPIVDPDSFDSLGDTNSNPQMQEPSSEKPKEEIKEEPKKEEETREVNSSESPAIIKARENVQRAHADLGKGHIVIVDDEAPICDLLSSIIESYGYSCTTYTEPLKALEAITENPPTLVCTDLSMPKLDGLSLFKAIRRDKVDVPVIFISAFVDNEVLIEGIELGASGFLSKPFEDAQVISLINQTIKKEETRKLLNRSLNFILYQFNDLDNYLQKEGKESLRQNLKSELKNILKLKKTLL